MTRVPSVFGGGQEARATAGVAAHSRQADLVDAHSHGAPEGSAKGPRNIHGRLALMNALVPLTGTRLLDVGCGRGDYTVEMARGFAEVDAIDVEADRLSLLTASRPANVRTQLMSGLRTDFADGRFDVVTAIETLEHVGSPAALFGEVARVLRPGGAFVLTTPNRWWPFEQHGVLVGGRRRSGLALPGVTWIPALHRRVSDADAFTRHRLRALATDAGLAPTGFRTMMPPLDSFADGSLPRLVVALVERTPIRFAAQTLVAAFRKPA